MAKNAATVAELCMRLEGIPLAIELVAAHCDTFAPAEMLAQVSERLAAERERTGEPLTHRQVLREALAWSYALLGPEEQALLARMGVFAGGCTLEAASAVCNPDGDLAIDNNLAERTLRPQAIGRKNWIFAGSDNGARTAAILYTMIASAKANGVDPHAYLRDLYTRLPVLAAEGKIAEADLTPLLPDEWLKAHPQATFTPNRSP